MKQFFFSAIIATLLYLPSYSNDNSRIITPIELNPGLNGRLRECVTGCEEYYLKKCEECSYKNLQDIAIREKILLKKSDHCVEVCTAIYRAEVTTKENRELVQALLKQMPKPNAPIGIPHYPSAPPFKGL